jgi:SAM-dependent methyltransferase
VTKTGRQQGRWYREDLAYIHDSGFADHAEKSAAGLMAILHKAGIHDGLVVELGCGSGLTAAALTNAGYRVLGVDISEAMIEIARKRAPAAEFRVDSVFTFKFPKCRAVIALGEVLNYAFDVTNGLRRLGGLFRQINNALVPGGLFIFDIAEPGQVKPGEQVRVFTEGPGWAVLAEKREDLRKCTLTRRIITFRKAGATYRRDEEVHNQRLFKATDLAKELRRMGFRVRTVRSYGEHPLLPRRAALIARKK